MSDEKVENIKNELEYIGFEFTNRVNEYEIIAGVLHVLKKHGVVYNEIDDLFEKIKELFKSTAKL